MNAWFCARGLAVLKISVCIYTAFICRDTLVLIVSSSLVAANLIKRVSMKLPKDYVSGPKALTHDTDAMQQLSRMLTRRHYILSLSTTRPLRVLVLHGVTAGSVVTPLSYGGVAQW